MKRAACTVLIIALALSLTACASIFNGDYFSSSSYDPPAADTYYEGATEVSSYVQLTIAINNLVAEHGERRLLHFTSSYPGDIAEDLASACREVRDETALGAYSVDYISYDLDRIVAYYEAEVYVYYKRTAAEMEDMISVNTPAELRDSIRKALADMSAELVAVVGASNMDEAAVLKLVDSAYFSDPLACVERPEAAVNVYTGGGFQRIVEIRFSYGATPTALMSRRSVLENALEQLAGSVTAEGAAYRAMQALTVLTAGCAHDETAPGTLWSALMAGESNSEGMAAAYKALCDMAGVECMVVEGRLDREEHYWNIITVEGSGYHVDPSRAMELGFGNTFLMNDAQMWGSYWWDDQDYPGCSGPLSYSALTESDRPPEATQAPEESVPPTEPVPSET